MDPVLGPEDYVKMHLYLVDSIDHTLYAIALILAANLLWTVGVAVVGGVRELLYRRRVARAILELNREAAISGLDRTRL